MKNLIFQVRADEKKFFAADRYFSPTMGFSKK
jgi:hypothetical protein